MAIRTISCKYGSVYPIDLELKITGRRRERTYVPRYLYSPVPMLPGTYVPRYLCSPNLCSPVPMFHGTYVPRTYVPQYLCSPVPMFPDLRLTTAVYPTPPRPTTCKTRPAGRVRPATLFCPAREMFLNYNGNRPAACHRPPLHYTIEGLSCLPLHRLKTNVITTFVFFRQRSLDRTMDCVDTD